MNINKNFNNFNYLLIFQLAIAFKSLKLYNNLKYYFKSREKEGYKAYESNIDPFLKYIHIQNIKPCGWVRIEKYDIAEDTGRCNYNISVDGKNVIPLDINKIAPILITSFDIECTSSHGDFPVAIKNYSKVAQDLALVAKAGYEYTSDFIIYWLKNIYKKDIIIDQAIDLKINRVYTKRKISNQYIDSIPVLLEKNMNDIISILDKISASVKSTSHSEEDVEEIEEENEVNMTIAQLNEEETKLAKILDSLLVPLEGDKIIQIGTTVHIYGSEKIIYKNIITLDTCDIIEDCDVLSCSTEKELLIKWKELMNELNSDIVAGYNIFGFDMPYIWDRAKELGILEEYSIGWGRLITRKTSLVEQKLSSSAMGDNLLKYFDMGGRIIIDLMKVLQRDAKLDSFKLDNVAGHFIGDFVDDFEIKTIKETQFTVLKANNLIGTTGSGIGPTYSNKMLRKGLRVEDFIDKFKDLGFQVVDMSEFWQDKFVKQNIHSILLEGAQGFGLDINWTNQYPYCTSSTCTLAGAVNTGIQIKNIRNIYGISKAYDTYVGTTKFQPEDDNNLNIIGEYGKEFGSTTGRRRQCNYLNLNNLKKALYINNCNICIVNKVDILKDLSIFKVIDGKTVISFQNWYDMREYILNEIPSIEFIFSESPNCI